MECNVSLSAQNEFLDLVDRIFNKKKVGKKVWSWAASDEYCMDTALSYDSRISMYCFNHYEKVFYKCKSLLDDGSLSQLQKHWIKEVFFCVAKDGANMGDYAFVHNIYKDHEIIDILLSDISKSLNYWTHLTVAAMVLIDEECMAYALEFYKGQIESDKELVHEYRDAFAYSFEYNAEVMCDQRINEIHKIKELFDLALETIVPDNPDSFVIHSSFKSHLLEKLNEAEIIKTASYYADKVRNNELWNNIEDIQDEIKVLLKYPNGKQGDVSYFIAAEYGRIRQVNELIYEATFNVSDLDKVELMFPLYFYGYVRDAEVKHSYDTIRKHNNLCLLDDNYCNIINHNLYIGTHPEYIRIENLLNTTMQNKYKAIDDVYMKLVVEEKTTPKWKSEQQVYVIVQSYYPDAIFQYKAEWLDYQSIDVFIPSIKVGIEYQGIQHYEPISHFGGEKGLKQTQLRDKKKKKLCKENGIKLIEWKYNEDISTAVLEEKIKKYKL